MRTDIIATPPPRSHARLTLAAAVTVLLALTLALLNPIGGAQRAQAFDGHPTFTIGSDRWAYYDFISKIRLAVNTYNNNVPGSSSTIDHTANIGSQRPESAGFYDVDIQTWNNPTYVRVRLRRSDLYVVGWWSSDAVYNYIDTTTAGSGAPSGSRPTAYRADYPSLEGAAGSTRYEVGFSRESMNNAIWTLYNARPSGNTQTIRNQAHAVLMLTQFLSEAVRFEGVANLIGPAMDSGATGQVPHQVAGEENNWAQLSKRFNSLLASGTSDANPLTAYTADYWGNILSVVLYQLSDY
ncbi:ribosome-inactivating family protein, partial [Streptomyces sp. NPDC002920]